MHFYETTQRTEDNDQTTVSAQKNGIFFSQRFYGLEKEIRKETQLYAPKKTLCSYHSATMDKQQSSSNNNNKGEPGQNRC